MTSKFENYRLDNVMPNYTRVFVEPVDVPLEADNSILLSTVQSAIPGAHGLYYRQNGSKVGLRYDAMSGKISPPTFGWNQEPLYVNIAHGCGPRVHTSNYEQATEQFSKTVELVKQLVARTSEKGGQIVKTSSRASTPTKTDEVLTNGPTSEEPVKLRKKRSTLEQNGYDQNGHQNGVEAFLYKEKRKSEESIPETPGQYHRSFDSSHGEKSQNGDIRVDDLLHDKATLEENLKMAEAKLESTLNENNTLRCEIIKHIEEKNQLRQEIGSHPSEPQPSTQHFEETIQKLTDQLAETSQELNNVKWRNGELEAAIHAKDGLIHHLQEQENNWYREKGDLERQLAEMTQNFNDTKWRNGELEAAIQEKDQHIHHLEVLENQANENKGNLEKQLSEMHQKLSELESSCLQKDQLLHDKESELQAKINQLETQLAESIQQLKIVEETSQQKSNFEEKKGQFESQIQDLAKRLEESEQKVGSLETEIGHKQDHINWLEGEKSRLEKELGQITQERDEIRHKASELESDVNNKQDHINWLESEKSRLESEKSLIESDLQAKISQLEVQLSESAQKLNLVQETNQQASNFEEEKGQLQGQIHDLNKNLEESRQKVTDLETDVNNKQNHINWLEGEKSRLGHEVGEVSQEKDNKQNHINWLEGEKSRFEQELGHVVQDRDGAKWRVGELETELGHKQNHINWLEGEKSRLENELGQVCRERDELKTKVQELEASLHSKEEELLKALEGSKQGPEDKAELEQKLQEIEQERGALTLRFSELKTEVGNKQDHVNWLEGEKSRLEQELSQVSQERNDAKWRVGELETETSNKQNHIGWLEGEKSRIEHRLGEVEEELKHKHDRVNELEYEVRNLDSQLSSSKDLVQELENKLYSVSQDVEEKVELVHAQAQQAENTSFEDREELTRQLEEANQTLNDAKIRINELESNLAEQTPQTMEAQDRIIELESKLSSIESEISEAMKKVRFSLDEESTSDYDTNGHDSEPSPKDIGHILNQLVEMSSKIQLSKENLEQKDSRIQVLEQKIRNLEESHLPNGGDSTVDEHQRRISELQNELDKLGQKLQNANEEKEFYKKEYNNQSRHQFTNGGAGHEHHEEFGKELMKANKERYELKNKVKKLDQELRETQTALQEREKTIKNNDKIIWLTKEKVAFQEQDIRSLQNQLDQVKAEKDGLEKQLLETQEILRTKEEEFKLQSTFAYTQAEIQRIRDECNQKVHEVTNEKNQLEEVVRDLDKKFNDAKWRIGELDSTVAHREFVIDGLNQKIRDLESGLAHAGHQQHDRPDLQHAINEFNWRVGDLDKKYNDAKWRVGELESEVAHKNYELEQAHKRILELESRSQGGEDLHRRLNELEGMKGHLEHRIGELNQFWNDAKWRIGELEATIRHKDWQLGETERRIKDLENQNRELHDDLQSKIRELRDSFVVRKAPYVDRQKWQLSSWENAVEKHLPLRRVWFDAESDGAQQVLLMGSFLNWECALLCDKPPEHGPHSRRGTWVDLPPGRYEFRFLVDGKWKTDEKYPICYNDYGTMNNWHVVE